MKNKVINSLKEMDWKEIPIPMVVIYKRPLDFPEKCVARVFNAKTGEPTPFCILRKTVEECREDVRKSGFYAKLHRAKTDDECIIESWI